MRKGGIRFMQRDLFRRAIAISSVLFGGLWMSAGADPPKAQPAIPESPAFSGFTLNVQEYVKLHKMAPPLRTTKKRKEIVDRRQALKVKIRETRADAKPGDMFTPEVSAEFRRVIKDTWHGPNPSSVLKTVRQGTPVEGWNLTVNCDYPEALPVTTVPPTLLMHLPQLPPGVAYRIVGHDFVLTDTEARLIVDFIPGVFP
jgi:hypothetical protein